MFNFHDFKLALAGLALGLAAPLAAHAESILVQSTTSTKNSGLYDYILPKIQEETGLTVNVVAVGTGQAIKNAMNCDADVLLVHAKPSEQKFVADGFGVKRYDLMYNDFILVGPKDDPAGVKDAKTVQDALTRIAQSKALFASRGDDSGTNKKEMILWGMTDVNPKDASGDWYRETGSGMGATLNAAVGMNAYTMSDRATWINFKNKGDFQIVFEGQPELFNQYGIIMVNPDKCPAVKVDASKTFMDWLLSDHGQEVIASYKVDGQQLFFPNASK
ncbi:MAG: substrate-binding domain-containing protein [Paracoccaceae bacterium]